MITIIIITVMKMMDITIIIIIQELNKKKRAEVFQNLKREREIK